MSKLIGIDTGFSYLGWAECRLTRDALELLHAGCIQTKKSNKKLNVLASDDNQRRTREIVRELRALDWGGAVVVAVEGQSWPRNSGVCAKIGHAWGVIITLAELHSLPIVQATPQQIKLRITGNRKATKQDVIDSMIGWNGFGELSFILSDYPRGRHEHIADACGAAVTAMDSDILRAARKGLA